MLDNPPGESPVFDFDELADHLLEQGLQNSPAELHGCVSGLLAGGADTRAEAGLAALCQALDLELFGELAAQVMALYQVTDAALRDDEFDFHLLLPEDEVGIEERTAALAGWCRGFLAGYAHASSKPAVGETGEILQDLAAIAEAGVDPEADEEESEGSLAEIVEYLRFAVLNLFMDRLAEQDEAAPPERDMH